MSRRRVAALFAAAVLAGAAVGLLAALLYGNWLSAPAVTPPNNVTDSVTPGWPAAYRCGVTVQPEDLDHADRCICGEKC